MHPALRALAERRYGVFTASEARAAGYGHPEIRHLCSSGRWLRLRQGVYISSEDRDRAETDGRLHRVDCLAALLFLDRPRTTVSHASAARLWGFPVPRHAATPLRLTDPDRWRRGEGFLMSRASLPPGTVWYAGPVRVTSAARTLADCAREWPLEDAVVAMDAALFAGRTTAVDLSAGAAAVGRWPGAPRAVRAARLADGRAESPLETRGRLRMVGSGLPPTNLQMEIRSGGRRIAVVDAWFEEAAVAVEFDSRIKYTDPWRKRTPERVLWEEKRREDELRALNIRVVRIVDADLGAPWPRTEGRLRELLASPGPAGRRFTATPADRSRRIAA
jgi:predicted transcriptional regulator of viral defense system